MRCFDISLSATLFFFAMAQELPMPPRTQAIQMVQDKVREIRKPKNHWSREWEIYGAKHIGFRAFIVGFFMEQERIYRYFMIFCLWDFSWNRRFLKWPSTIRWLWTWCGGWPMACNFNRDNGGEPVDEVPYVSDEVPYVSGQGHKGTLATNIHHSGWQVLVSSFLCSIFCGSFHLHGCFLMHAMVFNCLWNNFGQGWVCMLGWSGNDWMWKNRPQSFHAEFPCIWGSSETINLMNKSGFRFLGTSRLGKGFPFWFSDFNYSSVKPNTAKILCCPWQIPHMRRIFHCQLGALAPKNCLHLVGLVPDIKPSWRITGVLTIKQNNTSTWVCLKKYEHMVSRNLIVYHGFWYQNHFHY